MIDWKSFFANGGYTNGNSDPRSYECGRYEDEDDEEYDLMMQEEWEERMRED